MMLGKCEEFQGSSSPHSVMASHSGPPVGEKEIVLNVTEVIPASSWDEWPPGVTLAPKEHHRRIWTELAEAPDQLLK